MSDRFRPKLLLSTQRALLDAVTPNLRGVTVGWSEDRKVIQVRFYFDGPISEDDRDRMLVVGTEIISDFSDLDISEEIIRCDAPNKMEMLKAWAYSRFEQNEE